MSRAVFKQLKQHALMNKYMTSCCLIDHIERGCKIGSFLVNIFAQ